VGAIIKDVDLIASLDGRDATLWKEDVFELYLKPISGESPYLELQWSPLNQFTDVLWPTKEPSQWAESSAWNSHAIESAVSYEGILNDRNESDRSWTLEARIPFEDLSELSSAPSAGAIWQVMAVNFDYTLLPKWKKKKTSTAPCENYHQTERFGTLTFIEPGNNLDAHSLGCCNAPF